MQYRVAKITDFSPEALEKTQSLLSLSQQEYVSKKGRKAAESLAARALLSKLIFDNTGKDILSKISADQSGRLFIEDMPQLFVSISHSKGMVAVCCSDTSVGIDIERIRKTTLRLKKKIADNSNISDEEFFKIWTLREAYLKASGISFSKMLSLSTQEIYAKAEVMSRQYKDYYLSIVKLKK